MRVCFAAHRAMCDSPSLPRSFVYTHETYYGVHGERMARACEDEYERYTESALLSFDIMRVCHLISTESPLSGRRITHATHKDTNDNNPDVC